MASARARFRKTVARLIRFRASSRKVWIGLELRLRGPPTTNSHSSDTIPRHRNGLPSHRPSPDSGRVTLATAGFLACGSPHAPGLPSFPVARIGRTLAAYSCGGSQGFVTAWIAAYPVPSKVPKWGTVANRTLSLSLAQWESNFRCFGSARLFVMLRSWIGGS